MIPNILVSEVAYNIGIIAFNLLQFLFRCFSFIDESCNDDGPAKNKRFRESLFFKGKKLRQHPFVGLCIAEERTVVFTFNCLKEKAAAIVDRKVVCIDGLQVILPCGDGKSALPRGRNESPGLIDKI